MAVNESGRYMTKKMNKQGKIQIQIWLSMLLLFLAGCSHGTSADVPANDDMEEYAESSVIIENKQKINDGIHLSNDAKSYSALEKEIDTLMDGLPDAP